MPRNCLVLGRPPAFGASRAPNRAWLSRSGIPISQTMATSFTRRVDGAARWPSGCYLVFHGVSADRITILRFLNGAMGVEAHLLRDRHHQGLLMPI